MPLTSDHRQQFLRWLLEHDLRSDVAAAILETMPPFDWSNIARRDEMLVLSERLDGVDRRVETMNDSLNGRIDVLSARLETMNDSLNGRIDSQGDRIDSLGERMETMNDSLNGRIDGLYNAMLWGFASMTLGFVAVIVTVLVAAIFA